MQEAGFRYVFLGIENVLEEDLRFLKAEIEEPASARRPEIGECDAQGHRPSASEQDDYRQRLIVEPRRHPQSRSKPILNSPEDTWTGLTSSTPTPYPGTAMTKDFRDRGLIINEQLEEYDGTTAVVRTEHLSADEVEFLRWRAERWMKLRHMPAAFAHSPLFLLRNAPKMFAHTFRGSTIRSFLGLEDERKAFQRFQAIRRAERAYV